MLDLCGKMVDLCGKMVDLRNTNWSLTMLNQEIVGFKYHTNGDFSIKMGIRKPTFYGGRGYCINTIFECVWKWGINRSNCHFDGEHYDKLLYLGYSIFRHPFVENDGIHTLL
jgi:hypothetical protein